MTYSVIIRWLIRCDSGISLRSTDEPDNDGRPFVIVNPTFDGQDLAQDEMAVVNRIKGFTGIGDDVKIKEVMWASGFRCVLSDYLVTLAA